MVQRTKPKTVAKKPVSAATQEMLDAMSADDTRRATPDQLQRIRVMIAELRDLEMEKLEIEEEMRRVSERSRIIREKELVDLMDSAGVRNLGIEKDGNKPSFEVEIGPYYHANIAKEWEPERRAKAFSWLDRYHAGLLRNQFTVALGKGTRATQKKLETFLKKNKIPYTNEFGVPWNTLTAFVKEQIEEHKKTPPLDLLGATVGRVAKVKNQKEKR